MNLYLILRSDVEGYDEDEAVDCAFFEEEKASEFIDKMTELTNNVSNSNEWEEYNRLVKLDHPTQDDRKEIERLEDYFKDKLEYDAEISFGTSLGMPLNLYSWYYRKIDIKDAKNFFRQRKLEYLLNER